MLNIASLALSKEECQNLWVIPGGLSQVAAKKLNIKPLADRVVVRPLEEEVRTTPSGIVIPDTAMEKPQLGEVVAVGPGRISDEGKKIPISVKIGDQVFHSKYGGTNIKIEGDEYIILREDDILAIAP